MTRRRTSRPSTPRPRRIAGRDRAVPASGPDSEPQASEEVPESDLETGASGPASPEQDVEPEPVEEPEPEDAGEAGEGLATHDAESEDSGFEGEDEVDEVDEDEEGSGTGFASSPTTTKVLLSLLVVLAVLALAGGGYLFWQERDGSGPGEVPRASDERPVRITNQDAQLAASVAAEAAQTIISTSYQDFDKQLSEALELMTPEFAEQFRDTSADVENDVVKNKTEVEVEVRAQGVHRADARRVEALVFLNQLVTKNGKEPVLSPYRVLVTMERTSDGWLVAGLDTK